MSPFIAASRYSSHSSLRNFHLSTASSPEIISGFSGKVWCRICSWNFTTSSNIEWVVMAWVLLVILDLKQLRDELQNCSYGVDAVERGDMDGLGDLLLALLYVVFIDMDIAHKESHCSWLQTQLLGDQAR